MSGTFGKLVGPHRLHSCVGHPKYESCVHGLQAFPISRGLALGGWTWLSTAADEAMSRSSASRTRTVQAIAAPTEAVHHLPSEQHPEHVQQQQHEQVQMGLDSPLLPPQWAPPVGRPGLYDVSGRLVLKSLTLPELEAWCASEGEEAPANRALQLWRWMYADPPAGAWLRSLDETRGRQNGFSAKFIDRVGSRVTLDGGLQLSRVVRAADGTRKLVFTLTEGEAAGGSIETVLIPIIRQQGLRDRLTICVSSQVGCAMNCQFCYTGRMGLLGNLKTAQIVEQVVEARRFLAEEGDRTQLTNMVFMGMGEPLHNIEAVLAAADIVSHYMGLHISHNKITISTVGLVPEMRSIAARSRVQMALSLHATTDEVRDWVVPVNRRYDLATLTAVLEELFPKTQPPSKRQQVQLSTGSCPSDDDYLRNGREPRSEQQPRLTMPHLHGGGEVGVAVASAVELDVAGSGTGAQLEGSRNAFSETAESLGGQQQWLPPLGSSSLLYATVVAEGPSIDDTREDCSRNNQYDVGSARDSIHGIEARFSSTSPSSQAVAALAKAGAASKCDNSNKDASSSSEASKSSGSRSLLVGYTMLHGINDTLEDAHRLADMLARVNCKVNLIMFNPHAGTCFQPSKDDDVTSFRSALLQRGLVCTIRDSRGDDEMAACGQLGNVGLPFRPSPILEAPERFRRFLLPAAAPVAAATEDSVAVWST